MVPLRPVDLARTRAGAAGGLAALALVVASTAGVGCSKKAREEAPDAGDAGAPAPAADIADAAPSLFDTGADAGAGAAADAEAPPAPEAPRCPSEMVRVAGKFCVDRYEASLVENKTGLPLSPFHVPAYPNASSIHDLWERDRTKFGDAEAQAMPLPLLPPYERKPFEPRAISKSGMIPQGYATGELAQRACKNAGKRLCTLDEWRTACRGEANRQFPYGDTYEAGKCNVFREAHSAMTLHNNPSIGHSDPRLNLVRSRGKPLLRRAGATTTCLSQWGDDFVADMVGNVDEWIDDPEGTFVGGFFSRSTKDGCQSTIRAHGFTYFDYSTGVRCCSDLPPRG